ncbi:MAG: trehalose-phosphatase [Actinomycetota bacterium]
MARRARPTRASKSRSSSARTTRPASSPLEGLRGDPSRTGILLDFDGTLSPIVSHPDEAQALEGVAEILAELGTHFAEVAIISGRPEEEVRERVPVDGVRVVGLYGLRAPALPQALLDRVATAAAMIEGAWTEPKGAAVTVHFRSASDPEQARAALGSALAHLVDEMGGLEVIDGKMTLEIVPGGAPRKGGAVADLVRAAGLRGALYAGDDLADLEAFDALIAAGLEFAVRVAVRGAETPRELIAVADVVVDGPEGLLDLLRSLLPSR